MNIWIQSNLQHLLFFKIRTHLFDLTNFSKRNLAFSMQTAGLTMSLVQPTLALRIIYPHHPAIYPTAKKQCSPPSFKRLFYWIISPNNSLEDERVFYTSTASLSIKFPSYSNQKPTLFLTAKFLFPVSLPVIKSIQSSFQHTFNSTHYTPRPIALKTSLCQK